MLKIGDRIKGLKLRQIGKLNFTYHGKLWLHSRDNGNDFSFPVPYPFLKLNDNDVKSFLNGCPIF